MSTFASVSSESVIDLSQCYIALTAHLRPVALLGTRGGSVTPARPTCTSGYAGSLLAILAEAAHVAEAARVDPAAAVAALSDGAASCRILRSKLPKMFQRDFTPQFQLELMEKDVRYFLQLAADLDRPEPLASLVRSQYRAARRAASSTRARSSSRSAARLLLGPARSAESCRAHLDRHLDRHLGVASMRMSTCERFTAHVIGTARWYPAHGA